LKAATTSIFSGATPAAIGRLPKLGLISQRSVDPRPRVDTPAQLRCNISHASS
jgi:hypothetical protein